ncbi:MAG: FAD-dependent oxidoreductase [Verrucomicrobiota bacterium]
MGNPWKSQAAEGERIIIVGAGMAGVSAGRMLQDAGDDVILLEGRGRAGGRIWTSREWETMPMDLGASWIHGVRGNPLTTLANSLGIERKATDSNVWPVYQEGRLVDHGVKRRIERFGSLLRESIRQAQRLETDRSVEAAVEAHLASRPLSGEDRRLLEFVLNDEIEQDWAADAGKVSAWFVDDDKAFRGGDVLFPEGYDALIRYLAEGLDIRYQEEVSAISYDGSGVTISASSGDFRGDRVLVTLPLGVLKKGAVSFEPGLPVAKRQAIEVLETGVLNKICLRFPHVFWEKKADWISVIPEERGLYSAWLNLDRTTGHPVLVAFQAGTVAQELEESEDGQIVAKGMEVLRRLYGAGIPDPLEAQITRWASDPFSLGSYSCPGVGVTKRTRQDLAEPLGQRVFFAGEATNHDYPSTVHGAYLSGQREASRIQQIQRS